MPQDIGRTGSGRRRSARGVAVRRVGSDPSLEKIVDGSLGHERQVEQREIDWLARTRR